MIINWKKYILESSGKTDVPEIIVKNIQNDINEGLAALRNFDILIIVLKDGLRVICEPLYECGSTDIKDITKDFNTRKTYNELGQKVIEAQQDLLEKLKDNEVALQKFKELIDLREKASKLAPLYKARLIETVSNKDHVINELNRLSIELIPAFIAGIINKLGFNFSVRNKKV